MRVWKILSWGKSGRLAGAIISYRVFSAILLAVSLGGISHHIASTRARPQIAGLTLRMSGSGGLHPRPGLNRAHKLHALFS